MGNVSTNVAITIIFLYVTETMIVLTSIHWRVVLLEKTDYKFKDLTRITTTPDGLILASDTKANKIYFLK